MFKTSIVACILPAISCIIVTDPPPSKTDYRYSYDIEDPSTGDTKSQHEVRLGDVVTGAYSVVGPDGTKRIVEYTADAKHGFVATLREEPVIEEIRKPPPMQEPPQYYAKKIIQKPVAYSPLVQAKSRIPHAEDNRDLIFFTPANEITSDRLIFDNGKFFKPAAK